MKNLKIYNSDLKRNFKIKLLAMACISTLSGCAGCNDKNIVFPDDSPIVTVKDEDELVNPDGKTEAKDFDETIAKALENTPSPKATQSPKVTPAPTVKPTAKPSATPAGKTTPKPTQTPKVTSAPTATPVPSVEPTVAPTATPVPTVEPVVTPVPTATPVPTVEPTVTPVPTAAPTPEPTIAPLPADAKDYDNTEDFVDDIARAIEEARKNHVEYIDTTDGIDPNNITVGDDGDLYATPEDAARKVR